MNVMNTPLPAAPGEEQMVNSQSASEKLKIQQSGDFGRSKSSQDDYSQAKIASRSERRKKANKKSRQRTSEYLRSESERDITDSDRALVYTHGYINWMSPCKKLIRGKVILNR